MGEVAQHGWDAEKALEVERLRSAGDDLKQEFESLHEEFTKIGNEANSKIDAANVRIRATRQERDEVVREVEQLNVESRKISEGNQNLQAEKLKLIDQKEALDKIVED